MEKERKKDDYWKNRTNVIAESEQVIERYGFKTLPNYQKLWELGCSALGYAIQKYQGGFPKFRKSIGEEPKNWRDFGYTSRQANKVMEEHKLETIPSSNKLKELGHYNLSMAIVQYHGGFVAFRKALSLKQIKGILREPKDALGYAKRLMKEHKWETLPGSSRLIELGYTQLVTAVTRHHGGFHRFRELLGVRSVRRKSGSWEELEYTIKEAETVKEKHELEVLPGQKVLIKLGYSSLAVAILRYHGGFKKFRELLGEEPVTLTIKNVQEFLKEIKTDEPLRNLAAAALMLDGQSADVEQIIMDVYEGKFKDGNHLHSLLQDSTREIYDLIEEGITNLGRYIGDFNVGDRKIVPVLIGEAINLIPYDKISPDLEERLVRILRTTYSPRFNVDPEGTMAEIQTKRDGFEWKKRELYERLNRHYQETLELREVLQ